MIPTGRMGLLITAYLVLTNMSAAAMSFNAPVFTAIDAWFYICKLIVIAALFEFAVILREGPRRQIISVTRLTIWKFSILWYWRY